MLQKYLKFCFEVGIGMMFGDVLRVGLFVEVGRTDERRLLSIVLIAVQGGVSALSSLCEEG